MCSNRREDLWHEGAVCLIGMGQTRRREAIVSCLLHRLLLVWHGRRECSLLAKSLWNLVCSLFMPSICGRVRDVRHLSCDLDTPKVGHV